MNVLNVSQKNEYPTFKSFEAVSDMQQNHLDSAYIKQKIHDQRIDQFFWTDVEAPHKRVSPLAIIGSIAGVLAPVLFFAKKQKPELKIDSLKNLVNIIDIKYELPQILGVGLGGVLGGLTGGLLDRQEKHKIEKLEEASYQVMNVAFPAILVDSGIKLCEKFKPLNKTFIKMLVPVFSIFIGANMAVTSSNKLDDMFFDKHLDDGQRKFKKKDLIVHVDDVFGSLMLAKIPLAEKLHVNKILPAIFAWSGYHVGEA